jgi:5'-3' exonuclease
MIIHQFLTRHSYEIVQGNWSGFLSSVSILLENIKRQGVHPHIVFDEHRVCGKLVNANREEKREEKLKEFHAHNEMVEAIQQQIARRNPDIDEAANTGDANRVHDLLRQTREDMQTLGKEGKSSSAALAQAIGQYAKEAVAYVIALCKTLKIPFEVALYEGESQLVALQRADVIHHIIAYDSDLAVTL